MSAIIGTDIDKAKELLLKGVVVAIPTETVYGLAANALNEDAVAKIFSIKQRPKFDPLIIHVGSIDEFNKYVESIPPLLQALAEKYMPGPLTLLLKKRESISDLVTAGSDLVAVRIPDHAKTLSLLRSLPFPLAAPSANPFGYISPTNAQHVADQLGHKIEYILDGGQCKVGIESTIVGYVNDKVTIFRKGGLSIEKIKSVVRDVHVIEHSTSNPSAPGMLKSHYAPKTRVMIVSPHEAITKYGKNIGIIHFDSSFDNIPYDHQCILSPTRDYKEAARNLFSGMRRLDALGLDIIVAYLLPEEDLGVAINDKLRRAASDS